MSHAEEEIERGNFKPLVVQQLALLNQRGISLRISQSMTRREMDFSLDIIVLDEVFENLGFLGCWTKDEKKKVWKCLKRVAVAGIKRSKIAVPCDGYKSLVNVV